MNNYTILNYLFKCDIFRYYKSNLFSQKYVYYKKEIVEK